MSKEKSFIQIKDLISRVPGNIRCQCVQGCLNLVLNLKNDAKDSVTRSPSVFREKQQKYFGWCHGTEEEWKYVPNYYYPDLWGQIKYDTIVLAFISRKDNLERKWLRENNLFFSFMVQYCAFKEKQDTKGSNFSSPILNLI